VNINNIAKIYFLLILPLLGCSPSVRYTRDNPVNQPPVSQSDNRSSSQPKKTVDDDVDNLQSGWETPVSGTDKHQPDWLAVELSEADQGQPNQSNPSNKSNKSSKSTRPEKTRGSDNFQRLKQVVDSYIGVPYKYGGTTRRGFDCSGFTRAVYTEVYGISLKRTSGAMWKEGVPISPSAARPGDLVFFRDSAFGAIDHVGIYMGDNRFAHSSTTSGVVYSNLGETHYARRFAGVRRML